jgi:hypothetical protein
MRPSDFAENPIKLIPEEYFSGDVEGVGVFYDRFGDIRTSFVVSLKGHWQPDTKVLTLKEDLVYENNEKLFREYKITKVNDNHYIVETEDFDAPGKIEVYGNTMRWKYGLNQQIKDSKILLYFNDWMHLQPNGVILNRASASKFGILIGEVFMSIRKIDK